MTVWAAIFLWIVDKVLENADLAKRAKALVDCMRVSEIAGAQGTLEKNVKVLFLNSFRVLRRLFIFVHS